MLETPGFAERVQISVPDFKNYDIIVGFVGFNIDDDYGEDIDDDNIHNNNNNGYYNSKYQ